MRLLRSWLKNLCNSWNGLRRQSPASVRRQRPTLRPLVETLEDRLAPAGTGTGLLGQYYSGQNFNSLVATRTDATIANNWTGKAPIAGLSSTNYSVRWTGQLEALYSERTVLFVYSDDGARLKINGKIVIDAWADHSYREDSYAIQLVAGQKYQIELEYKQNTGTAAVQLAWMSTSQKWSPIQSKQLYASASVPAPAPAPAATTALRGTLAAGNVTAAGGTSFTFNVTYGGGPGLQTSSLGADVRITGPNSYSQTAAYAGIVGSSAAGVTVRYQVSAPGGSWDAGDNGSYTVSLLANEVRDTSGVAVPAGTLGSFAANIADWFTDKFDDPAITALARSLAADRTFSRADMLAVFQTVKTGGVSATELTDLKTLVANATYLGMPGYVQNLASKVVIGDAANARFQGAALGNLRAGSTTQHLDNLVGKWFLGLDRPLFVATGVAYTRAAGTLFGTGPAYADVVQGQVSDCYFLATLSEVAFRSPQSIRDSFIDNGDGTLTVRFFNNGKADYVTVDRFLPTKTDGTLYFASKGRKASDATVKLWVALYEKAYAQLAESGWSRPGFIANNYESLRGGWEGSVVPQIINRQARYTDLFDSTTSRNAIISAVQTGRMVWLDSKNATSSEIVKNHVYVVTGYNAATQTFNTWNAWGYAQQLTWAQVAANFYGYTVVV